ncbi:MAG TPA: SDR family oxidoreductase [Acidimicrobiales bacterium]
MKSFKMKTAIVTGGGSGMGRELVLQLVSDGCSVATCDVNAESVAETVSRALVSAPAGVRVTGHQCDVSDEEQVKRFRDEVINQHGVDHLDLVFNNAGISGGGSFIADTRESWERTFGVDWWGVYFCTRAFLPLLIKSDDAVLVNTSSINGFWASLGPGIPHTAYCTAKFAVKGFSEALIEDLRLNAPHVKVAVVMPGHIGTDIVNNSRKIQGEVDPFDMTDAELEESRRGMSRAGLVNADTTLEEVRKAIEGFGDKFRDSAPLSAKGAAQIILAAVLEGQWRILVGDDAKFLDEQVRLNPEAAYDYAGIGSEIADSIIPD